MIVPGLGTGNPPSRPTQTKHNISGGCMIRPIRVYARCQRRAQTSVGPGSLHARAFCLPVAQPGDNAHVNRPPHWKTDMAWTVIQERSGSLSAVTWQVFVMASAPVLVSVYSAFECPPDRRVNF